MGEPDPTFSAHAHSMHGVPEDAQLMGLDRNTEEGALVAMAGSLRGNRPSHRLIAWVIIVSLVAPGLLAVVAVLF